MAPVSEGEEAGIFRLTREQYHAIPTEKRTELLDGLVFEIMGQSGRHFFTLSHLAQRLATLVSSDRHVRTQGPVIVSERSEPEPDISVVLGSLKDYASRHPRPNEVILVIEVSDSTLAKDRGRKSEIYALAEIPEYWIVDLVNDRIERRTRPRDGLYRTVETFLRGDEIEGLSVDEILGAPPSDSEA